jgi:hypothetical protein
MRNGLSVTATDLGDWLSGRQPVTPGGLHYEMMEMSWTTFIGVVTLAFLLLNLNSGSAWARLPDAIAKQPDLTLGASDKLGAVQPVSILARRAAPVQAEVYDRSPPRPCGIGVYWISQ